MPRNRNIGEKTEVTYTRLVKAYFYHAFATLERSVISDVINDETAEPLPANIFLLKGKKEEKSIYYDPAPRSLGLVVNLVVAVHNRVMQDIANNDNKFISELLTIPEVRIRELAREPEPRSIIDAYIRNQIADTHSTIIIANAHKALMLFVKALVEAILNCIIISKHLPGTKTYLPRLCQVARMPVSLIQFARNLPPPESRGRARIATCSSQTVLAPAPESDDVGYDDGIGNSDNSDGYGDGDGDGDDDE